MSPCAVLTGYISLIGLVGGDTAEKVLVMSKIKKKLRKKMDKVN